MAVFKQNHHSRLFEMQAAKSDIAFNAQFDKALIMMRGMELKIR
ncbi:hypothetical protein [Methylomonas sp. MgM2]